MRPALFLMFCAAISAASVVRGAGFAHDENFTVLAPDQDLAKQILASANQFRREISQEWFGEELPPSVGAAVINVQIDANIDKGMTWAIDNPQRKYHKVWLTTSPDRALGSTLKHEITHVVFATWFSERLPTWAEEGCASRYDNKERVEIRKRSIGWTARTGNWPDLNLFFDQQLVSADDQLGYSIAASLVEMLIEQGGMDGKQRFVRFAIEGKQKNWSSALEKNYGIESVDELQLAWQDWVTRNHQPVALLPKSDMLR